MSRILLKGGQNYIIIIISYHSYHNHMPSQQQLLRFSAVPYTNLEQEREREREREREGGREGGRERKRAEQIRLYRTVRHIYQLSLIL